MSRDPFDTPFFRDREAAHRSTVRRGAAGFGALAIITLLLNFAFWGGLIFFAFWCLQHFGVI